MLVQVDILHKTDAYYVMDYDVRLPNRDRLLPSIVFEIQFNPASLTRPGIRMILVSCGLKIVTDSKEGTLPSWGEKDTNCVRDNPPHSGFCV